MTNIVLLSWISTCPCFSNFVPLVFGLIFDDSILFFVFRFCIHQWTYEIFEDIKVVIKCRQSQKDRRYKDRRYKDRRYTGRKRDKGTNTKIYKTLHRQLNIDHLLLVSTLGHVFCYLGVIGLARQ
jgi:hypothetical protein